MVMTSEMTTTEQARSKRVELIIRQLEALPTLPAVATRLLRATTATDSSFKEIVSLIESDQSLTAKILTLVRKAHLGLGNTITTVDKAVVMMGLEAVRNAVLSIQVFETFGPTKTASGEEEAFDRLEFWKHSLAVACAGQLISERWPEGQLDPDEIFVCGLLHDLGKVVFDTCLPKSFARVVKIADTNRTSIADVERRIFGLDHAAVGKKLAQQWELPEPIMHAVWLHHHKSSILPKDIGHGNLIDVIYLADLIAREQRIGFSGNPVFMDRSEPFARQLGISTDDYQNILLELRKRMGERASLIGLDQLSTEELYQQALQVANAELGRLNQSLTVTNRGLRARARYFDAINQLHRHLKPGMAITEMLEHSANALRVGLDLPSLVAYREDREHGFLEAAFANGKTSTTNVFEMPQSEAPTVDSEGDSLLLDPDDFLRPVIAHHAKKLGGAEIKVIRLASADREIGGVLFACGSVVKERLSREKQEVAALVTACGLALGQSLVLEAKDQLADDLLALTRQTHELEQKLLESRCLAALGEFAAGAAHELNNPLAIISGRAQLLRDQEDDEEKHKSLDIVIDQAARASEMISELMDFARPVRAQRQMVDLKELLENEAKGFTELRNLNPDQITVEITDQATGAYCDPQQLAAAVQELLTNAADAADPEAVTVRIKTVAEDDPKYLQIRIADNGPGMEPEVLDKALDMFFSAQKAGRKKGLGLPRTYRYIQANDGMFWLESQKGLGTTAFIRLPSRPTTDPNSKDARGI